MFLKSILLITALFLTSCSSNYKTFTNGEYEDPKTVTLLNDSFNEADIHKITPTMIKALAQCSRAKETKPYTLLGYIENNTSEAIDTDLILKQIRTQLLKNNYFNFVDRDSRATIAHEKEFQKENGLEYNKIPDNAQLNAQYIINGSIHSNVQTKNDTKIIYYYFQLTLTSLHSSVIECTEEKEIKKVFELD